MSCNQLRVLRQADKALCGIHLSFLCPEVIEFFGFLGYEWLFLDAEHMPLNHHLCRELVRAADGVGLPCMVRVPEIKASVIEGFLDAGVMGIMAPNVSSAEDAQSLVSAVKFWPDGERGAAAKSRAANYGLTQSAADYCRKANQTTFTVALIETQKGIDNLESIMSVPGIDYIAIGPNDLGFSLGIEGGMADPGVRTVVQEAEARIRAFGKPQLAIVPDSAQARMAVESGARLVAVPDAALLAGAGRSFLEKVRN